MRGSEEFARVLNFSDALFAIALTLLIVTIEVPSGSSGAPVEDLAGKVRELWPQISSFLLSFVVIGHYWLAHHRMVARLDAVSAAFVVANLGYLATVAFFPFPTALLGEQGAQTFTVALYAACAAVCSGVEAALIAVAYRGRLFGAQPDSQEFRTWMIASLIPVAAFLASIPVTLVGPGWAMLVWVLILPAEKLLDRTQRGRAAADPAETFDGGVEGETLHSGANAADET